MRILLFGKNGQIARTFTEEARGSHEVIALGRAHTDLMQAGSAAKAFDYHRPEIVINASAYTAVDKAEADAGAALRLNADAVGEIAGAAKVAGAHFIHISTDYVFDGVNEGAYSEDDVVNPINVYGDSKWRGEVAALTANDQTVILRTSWVFSEFGENFVKTMLDLVKSRSGLTVVADQIGGPTSARDAARAVLAIAGKKQRGAPGAGIYHYQGTPAVSWADFARKIFEIAGKNVDVTDITTEDFPTPAARPRRTVLQCAKIERDFGIGQPDWRASLRQVIAALEDQEKAS